MEKKSMNTLLKRCLLGGVMSVAAITTTQAATVDLLITYDETTNQYFSGQVDTAMRSWVDQINTIYSNSQIDVQLRLAGTMYYNIAGTDMGDVLGKIRVDSAIAQKREEVGADFVSQLHSTGACGLGYVAVDKNWAFNVVGPNCGAQVLAHELGHNMGLTHSRLQGDTGGTRFGYALGYGVDSVFATTMAYPGEFHTNWMPTFSNPRLSCYGLPCGIYAGQAGEADATSAINNVRDEIAGFFTASSQPAAYRFVAKHSGKCLDVNLASTENGADIIQSDCHGGNNQRFQILDAGDGYWYLQALHSGKCVDVRDVATNSGAAVQQWDCAGSDNQKLLAANLGDNLYQMAFKHSGICLDISGAATNSGAQVIQSSCHGDDNQRFYLEQVQ